MEQKPSLEDILRSEEVTPQKGPVTRKPAPAEDQNKKKGKKGRKRTVLWIVLAVLALLLVGGGIWAYRVLVRPETMFTSSTATVTEAPQKERVESAFDLSSFLPTAAPEEQAPATAEAQAATPFRSGRWTTSSTSCSWASTPLRAAGPPAAPSPTRT